MFRTMERLTAPLIRLLGGLGLVALAAMCVTICYDAVMRYAFAAPTLWSLEVNTFLVIFLALAPAGEVLRLGGQIRITFLVERLPGRARLFLEAAGNLVGAAFSGVMVWQGLEMTWKAWAYNERMSTSLGTPMVIPYFFLPLGFAVLGLQYLLNLAKGGAPADEAGQEDKAAGVEQQL